MLRGRGLGWLAVFSLVPLVPLKTHAYTQEPVQFSISDQPQSSESLPAPNRRSPNSPQDSALEPNGPSNDEPAASARDEPSVLRDPSEEALELADPEAVTDWRRPFFRVPNQRPRGFAGESGILPREVQTTSQFEPVEDRWRLGLPDYDRYGNRHPEQTDAIGVPGNWWDPYNQNILKGDYPLIGQDLFLRTTLRSTSLFEGRQLPITTNGSAPTRDPNAARALGDPDSFQSQHYETVSLDLFQGNTTFKPPDWRVRMDAVFNMNHFVGDVPGSATTSPDSGQSRFREDFTLQEWFLENRWLDTSSNFDFMSTRIGSQSFISDFRGFIFADTNRGLRLFGTRHANQDQYNLVWFDQLEKDTNSFLNRLEKDRHQNTFIANYYRQDWLFPGHNVNVSLHVNRDQGSIESDRNGFPARPDAVPQSQLHRVDAVYFGAANHGHIQSVNVSGAAYYVLGHDQYNAMAGGPQDISAWLTALELSYDRDWLRLRTSYLHSSGDANPDNAHATGFDAIFPNPNFAGSDFSYWGRQAVRLYGVELTNRQSLLPSLRSSKFQGQSNFVNPGLHLFNLGMDADLTPKWKITQNTNWLWFDQTEVLEKYLNAPSVRKFIGTDISLGSEYRPYLNNNIILVSGLATLIAGEGFRDLFRNLSSTPRNHLAGFVEATFQY